MFTAAPPPPRQRAPSCPAPVAGQALLSDPNRQPTPPPTPALLQLVQAPPATRTALERRCDAATRAALRRDLADRICAGCLAPLRADCLPLLFRLLGAGAERGRLTSVLLDAESHPAQRAWALAALFHEPDGAALFPALGPRGWSQLAEPWVEPVLAAALLDPAGRSALADWLRVMPRRPRGRLLSRIARVSRALAVVGRGPRPPRPRGPRAGAAGPGEAAAGGRPGGAGGGWRDSC